MSERYKRIFSLEENLYCAGAPVVIKAGALLIDQSTGELIGQLKLQNVTNKIIKLIKVEIICLDSANRPLGDTICFEYLDLLVPRDQSFGSQVPIKIPNPSTRSYSVRVLEVVFNDNAIWVDDGCVWSSIPAQKSIFDMLSSNNAVEGYKSFFGSDAKYTHLTHEDIWICTCGEINHTTENNCHRCNASIIELHKGIDVDTLEKEGCYVNAIRLSQKDDIESLEKAIVAFEDIGDYKDSLQLLGKCKTSIEILKNKERDINAKKKKGKTLIACIVGSLGVLFLLGFFVVYPLVSYLQGDYKVFVKMYKVKEFTVPYGETSIDYYEFENCTSLEKVNIPDTIEIVSQHAFIGCTRIQFNQYDNAYYIGNESNPYLVLVEAVNNNIKSCTVHEDTKTIANWAFGTCNQLKHISIPDTVTIPHDCDHIFFFAKNIEYNIYGNCKYIGNEDNPYFILMDSIDSKSYEIHPMTKYIYNGAFSENLNLESIYIPDSVIGIQSLAFYNCTKLEDVRLSNNLSYITGQAFGSCTSLKELIIPKSIKYIGRWVFSECTNLEKVYYTGTEEDWLNIEIRVDNDYFINAKRYYNSDN